jgi:DnaJ-class molecular chaperone
MHKVAVSRETHVHPKTLVEEVARDESFGEMTKDMREVARKARLEKTFREAAGLEPKVEIVHDVEVSYDSEKIKEMTTEESVALTDIGRALERKWKERETKQEICGACGNTCFVKDMKWTGSKIVCTDCWCWNCRGSGRVEVTCSACEGKRYIVRT